MKKNIFLFLLLTGLFYSSCKKDPFKDKTIIEGYILEDGSEKPLPNVKIYFSGLVSSEILGTEVWTTVDSIITDQNGYAYYEYNHNDVTIDKATFNTPYLYYPIMLHAINERQVNDISRWVVPYAWVNVRVKNVNPLNSSDKIRFTVSPGSTGLGGGGGWTDFYGENIDEETLFSSVGNKEDTKILWKVTKNGLTNEFRDTVYFNAHDTTHYEILY